MDIFKVVANRQLAEYTSADKNINVGKKDIFQNYFQDIFQNIIDTNILTINNQNITINNSGDTKRVDFTINDIFLNKSFFAYFAKNPRELRLQLKEYVEERKIIPGDIIILYIEFSNSNCNIGIKSDSIYRYMLERKSKTDVRYRIFTEYPSGTNNAGVTVSEYTDEYLSSFNIEKLDDTVAFGTTEFTAYSLEGCTKKYIGVPYNKHLKLDCFEDIEEIL